MHEHYRQAAEHRETKQGEASQAKCHLHWETGAVSPSSTNLHTSSLLCSVCFCGRVVPGEEEHNSVPMCCYVGKATKIFLCIVAALLVVGLVLGFGLAHRTWGARRTQPAACRWPGCQPEPVYGGDPLPYATTPPSVPLTEPAVAAFPGGVASSTAAPPYNPLPKPAVEAFPGAAPSTAAPPTSVPYFGPPSPFAVGLGPSSHA